MYEILGRVSCADVHKHWTSLSNLDLYATMESYPMAMEAALSRALGSMRYSGTSLRYTLTNGIPDVLLLVHHILDHVLL